MKPTCSIYMRTYTAIYGRGEDAVDGKSSLTEGEKLLMSKQSGDSYITSLSKVVISSKSLFNTKTLHDYKAACIHQ